MTHVSPVPLHLPAEIEAEAEQLAASGGTSLNEFVASAVAQKIAAIKSANDFASRRGKADWAAFDQLMNRTGGLPPCPGDELPDPS